jgi:ATP-binding cassette subfamily B protein
MNHANPEAPPPLRRLLALAWGYRGVCARIFAGQLASLALGLGALGASGLAIDVVRAAIDPGAPAVRWPFGLTAPPGFGPGRTLVALAAIAFALATLRALIVYGTASAVGKLIHVDLVPELRARVFAKLQRLPLRFFARNPSGAIINRVTSDVQSLRSFIDGVLVQGALMVFAVVTIMAYMARVHVGLLAACLAPTPLILLATLRFSRWARPAYETNRASRQSREPEAISEPNRSPSRRRTATRGSAAACRSPRRRPCIRTACPSIPSRASRRWRSSVRRPS